MRANSIYTHQTLIITTGRQSGIMFVSALWAQDRTFSAHSQAQKGYFEEYFYCKRIISFKQTKIDKLCARLLLFSHCRCTVITRLLLVACHVCPAFNILSLSAQSLKPDSAAAYRRVPILAVSFTTV